MILKNLDAKMAKLPHGQISPVMADPTKEDEILGRLLAPLTPLLEVMRVEWSGESARRILTALTGPLEQERMQPPKIGRAPPSHLAHAAKPGAFHPVIARIIHQRPKTTPDAASVMIQPANNLSSSRRG